MKKIIFYNKNTAIKNKEKGKKHFHPLLKEEYKKARRKCHDAHFKQVKCVETGEIFKSINETAKKLGTRNSYISDVINHRNGFYKGKTYIFLTTI